MRLKYRFQAFLNVLPLPIVNNNYIYRETHKNTFFDAFIIYQRLFYLFPDLYYPLILVCLNEDSFTYSYSSLLSYLSALKKQIILEIPWLFQKLRHHGRQATKRNSI